MVIATVLCVCLSVTNLQAQNEAKIGTTEYPTLDAAVTAAAAATDTIVILQDIADLPQQTIDKDIIINLNNHTLSGSTAKLINITSGNVSLMNGSITSTAEQAIEHAGTGTLTLTDCEISGTLQVVHVGGGGTVNAKKTDISSTGNRTVYNQDGVFSAIGCKIINTSNAMTIQNASTLYLEDDTIIGGAQVIYNSTGVARINGGVIRSKTALNGSSSGTITNLNGTMNIYGNAQIQSYYRAIVQGTSTGQTGVVNFGGYQDGSNFVAVGEPSIVLKDTAFTPTGSPYAISVYYDGTVNIFGDASITATSPSVAAAIGLTNGGSANITGGTIETYNDGVLLGNWVYPSGTQNTLHVSDSAFIQSTHGETVNNTNTYPSEVEIWGGVFSEDVSGEKCREGYAAFPLESNPGYFYVAPSYKILLIANYGTEDRDSCFVRQATGSGVLKANPFVHPTNLTFSRWNTKADEAAGSTNYALGATYDVDANLDLYAVWRLNLDMEMVATDVVCYGENNGTDTVKIIGGDAPYQIVLSSTVMAENDTVKNLMDRTYIFTNLVPGTYNVQLTDVLTKDTIRGTFSISQPDTLIVESMTVPENPCPLMGSGVYDVSMTTIGGNGGNHFTWGEATVNVDAMASTVIPGADDRDSTYTVAVKVTDKKGCVATDTTTFTVSKVIADDGTVHSNSKLTIDTIRVGIMSGCDTVYKEYGTPVFTTTIPGGYPEDRLTIVNNIATAYPDSVFYLGENKIIWTATDTCGHSITGEQVLIVYHFPCPNVTDVDGNDYTSVRLGCDCWMAENLRTSKYSDGRDVSNLMKYESPTHPDADANFAIYGYLYDWTAALDAENGVTMDAEGLVQGICPTGWHMPTDLDFMSIAGVNGTNDISELRYNGYWLDGGGDNSTGFSLLPGGFYNDNTARYENILGEAYLWSVNSANPGQPKVFWADCKCYLWQVGDPSANLGCSVRCVKD